MVSGGINVGAKKLYAAVALAGILLLGFITTSVISYSVAQQTAKTHIAQETLPLTSDNVYSEIEKIWRARY